MADLGVATDPGRVRSQNQDRYLVRKLGGTLLLAVADGVAGEAGGDVAAAAAVAALESGFDSAGGDVAAALAAAVRGTNDAVLQARNASGHTDAATTMVAAAVRGKSVVVANLGDSRAYLVHGGEAHQITTDHSGPIRHSITRFVGDPRGVSPDVFVEPLGPHDRLVLCSDGLTRHVTDHEIAETVAHAPPDKAARSLVDRANEMGGKDNVTVIVYASPRGLPRAVRVGALLALAILIVAIASVALGASR